MTDFTPMTQNEMQHVKGGIVPLLIIAGAALLVSGCTTTKKVSEVTHDPDCTDTTHAHTQNDGN